MLGKEFYELSSAAGGRRVTSLKLKNDIISHSIPEMNGETAVF